MSQELPDLDDPALDKVIERQSLICGALSNPTRLRIIYLLKDGPMAQSNLGERLGISRPLLSQHLKQMRSVGVVESRREGNSVTVSLAAAEVGRACDFMRGFLVKRMQEQGELARRVAEAEVEVER